MSADKVAGAQVLLIIPRDLLAQIEAYWHEERLPNRSEAIRKLIQLGLGTKAEQ